jgi:tetratricopeptide (TPR) repeat protein
LSTLAEVRLGRQNWSGAEKVAEAIRKIGDNNQGLADQILGVALSGRAKLDESIQALQSAYAANAGATSPMVALVIAYARAKQTDRAIAFLEDVLRKNPDNAEALVLLGSTQLLSNASDQAVKSFQAAIDKQPKSMAGYRALAGYHLARKSSDEALKVIRKGLEAQPESFEMRLLLASTLELKGDYEGAIAEYERLLTQQSGSLVVANNLASLLSDHRTDKASLERAYALAVSLRKTQLPQFKDTLGWVQHQRGDYRAAIPLLEEAAAALPDLAMVRYHLGMSYLANGQFAKASEQFKKALELTPDSGLEAMIRAGQEKAAM